MPFDYTTAVQKTYSTLPVSLSTIPSHHISNHKSNSSSNPNPNPPEPVSKIRILWVGCSDSSILETDCLGVEMREEMFVHRNLGNILSNGDLSTESALEWCVELLKVDHIVVCGHYDCALIKKKADPGGLHGWYKDVNKLHTFSDQYLLQQNPHIPETTLNHRFEEIYVLAEVDWLKKQENVKKAIEERGLQVHAFVYEKEGNECVRLVESGRETVNNGVKI